MWQNIKTNILKAADESLGRRRVMIPSVTKYKTPWYKEEVKILAIEKWQAFLKYISI